MGLACDTFVTEKVTRKLKMACRTDNLMGGMMG
jgi:hypothetical protein